MTMSRGHALVKTREKDAEVVKIHDNESLVGD